MPPWYKNKNIQYVKDHVTELVHSCCNKKDESSTSQLNIPRGYTDSISSSRAGASRQSRLGKRQENSSLESFDLEDLRRELENDPQAEPNEEIFEKFVDDLEEFGVDEEPYIVRTQKFNKKGKSRGATGWVTSWNGVIKDDNDDDDVDTTPKEDIKPEPSVTGGTGGLYDLQFRRSSGAFYQPNKAATTGTYYGPDVDEAPAPFYNPHAIATPKTAPRDNDSAVINFALERSLRESIVSHGETMTINSATDIAKAVNETIDEAVSVVIERSKSNSLEFTTHKEVLALRDTRGQNGSKTTEVKNYARASHDSPVSYNAIFRNDSRVTTDSMVAYDETASSSRAKEKENTSSAATPTNKKTRTHETIADTIDTTAKDFEPAIAGVIRRASMKDEKSVRHPSVTPYYTDALKDATGWKTARISSVGLSPRYSRISEDTRASEDSKVSKDSRLSRDGKISKDVRVSNVAVVIDDGKPKVINALNDSTSSENAADSTQNSSESEAVDSTGNKKKKKQKPPKEKSESKKKHCTVA